MGKYRLQIAYDVLLTLGFPLCAAYIALVGISGAALDGIWIWRIFLILAAGYWLAVFVLGVGNIRQSFRKHKKKDAVFCVNAMLILKYGLVAFFIVNFAVIVFGFLAVGLVALMGSRGTIIFAFPAWFPVVLAAAGFYAFLTWLLMLPGSFYGIQVIRFSHAEGKISGGMGFLHVLLQFLFLADVLDALYLAVRKWGRGKRSSILVGGLYVAAILAAAVCLGHLWH